MDFEQVYAEYHSYVYRYVLSLCRNVAVAEDVTSEAFLKALKHIGQFKGECDIKVWLCQIAKNTYFAYNRRRRIFYETSDPEAVATDHDPYSDRLETLEIHKRLHNLGEPHKEVFSLRVFGGLSFADIAELFGKTESWARVTYHRAKQRIGEGLK